MGIWVRGEGEPRGQAAEAVPDGRQHRPGKRLPWLARRRPLGGLPAWEERRNWPHGALESDPAPNPRRHPLYHFTCPLPIAQ